MNRLKFIPFIILLLVFEGCKTKEPLHKIKTESVYSAETKSVDIGDEKIHYIEKGNGPPVIMVHGAISDYDVWALQMDTIAINHRAIAISRRYAWPNRQPEKGESFDCSVESHSNDLVKFMEALDIPSAHLIGHSYGAMIILRTAIDHPQKVRSLVLGEPIVEALLSGSVKGDSLITDFQNDTDVAVSLYEKGDKEETIRQFLATVLGSDEAYDAVLQNIRDGWKQNLVETICISRTKDFASISREELEQIQAPTLLIKGEFSPAYLTLASDSLNTVIPNSTLKTLPNASHGLQGTNPSEFNRLSLSFIDDL